MKRYTKWKIGILAAVVGISLYGFFFSWSKEDLKETKEGNQAYISIDFSGGQLGNQMFDIAATLAYAWDHHLQPLFPALHDEANRTSYNRDRIFFRLDTSESPVPLTRYVVSNPGFVQLPANLKNVALNGGFFSWRYFDHHRRKVQEIFAASDKIVEKLQSKYTSLIASEKTVSVHVRTYSKQIHEEGLHFVGLKFFKEAMGKFSEDSIFVIFSDRIEWCKANFRSHFPDKTFVFIEGNDHIEDMYLMSMMKHQILSRSTFSWWAAYLNRREGEIIYPLLKEETLRAKLKPYVKSVLSFFGKVFWWDENFYLPEWQAIYYWVEPFPEDIYDYGDESTSVYFKDK